LEHPPGHLDDVVDLFLLIVDKPGDVRQDDLVGAGERSALRRQLGSHERAPSASHVTIRTA
jgi:hypothetical protein